MNVSLTKPLEYFVQEKVDSGMYASASEVIRAGLRMLAESDLDTQLKKGLEQSAAGLGNELNDDFSEKLMQRVQERIAHPQ